MGSQPKPEAAPTPHAVGFGGLRARLAGAGGSHVVDLLLAAGVVGLLAALVSFGREWAQPMGEEVHIDLSPAALPMYALYSLGRGLAAYVLSLVFTLVYGAWAAKDQRAERVLIPLLDVLQSVPVLGFLPGVVLVFVRLFPTRTAGLELAAIVMIFTGQVWNMTLAYYQSLRSVPGDLKEAAYIFKFSAKAIRRQVEMPCAVTPLVWNSMMSMAGGWFFLMVSECFVLGDHDYRLPGLGSAMSVASERGDVGAMVRSGVAMVLVIVALDQLLWRPLVVWSQRYRIEEGAGGDVSRSWVLDLIQRSAWVAWVEERVQGRRERREAAIAGAEPKGAVPHAAPSKAGGIIALALLVCALTAGAAALVLELRPVTLAEWSTLGLSGLATLGRVLLATALGTAWALPAGIAIGLSARWSRVMQPLVQVAASFPAPMLFPGAVIVLKWCGVTLEFGSIVLMLLGTQWYILFNVVAGAKAIPSDLREAASSFRMGLLQRFTTLYFPAVFPQLVTGWVTAAGGAWNASIVSEVVSFRGETLTATGLGARVSEAASAAHFPQLAAAVAVMSLLVVSFNRLVWSPFYRLAERRYSLNR